MSDLDTMVAIAREASAEVARHYRRHEESGIEVTMKGPGDPVTVADEVANEMISEALKEAFPDCGVVAEESAPNDVTSLRAALKPSRVFFVDPVDGTKEFLDKNGQFCVMIGLVVDGRLRAGVVAAPARDCIYGGQVGKGAWMQRNGEREPLHVSTRRTFSEATLLVSRSHLPPIVEPLRKRLGIGQLKPHGSAGLKTVGVANGEADLYVHDGPGMKLWDVCAPDAIVTAAGGRLSDLSGQPFDYVQRDAKLPGLKLKNGLCASNGILHAGVLSAVEWARRQT